MTFETWFSAIVVAIIAFALVFIGFGTGFITGGIGAIGLLISALLAANYIEKRDREMVKLGQEAVQNE